MTLAVTSFKCIGHEFLEPLRKRGVQYMLITGTGAATDLTHNLASVTGALLSGLSSANQAIFTQIASNIDYYDGLESPTLQAKECVSGGPTTGQYSVAMSASAMPTITYATADAPTAFQYVVKYILDDDVMPFRTSNA